MLYLVNSSKLELNNKQMKTIKFNNTYHHAAIFVLVQSQIVIHNVIEAVTDIINSGHIDVVLAIKSCRKNNSDFKSRFNANRFLCVHEFIKQWCVINKKANMVICVRKKRSFKRIFLFFFGGGLAVHFTLYMALGTRGRGLR